MRRDLIAERFFSALISGDRAGARELVEEAMGSCGNRAEDVLVQLFWPTAEHIQRLYRADQLSRLAHNFSTRLMRSLAEQLQARLEQQERNGRTVLVVCGDDQGEELGAQICADLLEAHGFVVFFTGGGVANDELVSQVGQAKPHVLVVFGAIPATVPQTRQLIDRLHDIGLAPETQIVVGGGVFNRADELPMEIGADLWAGDPDELVQTVLAHPERRMTPDQRSVGGRRNRKQRRGAA